MLMTVNQGVAGSSNASDGRILSKDQGFVHSGGKVHNTKAEREGIEPSEILYFTVVMSF